MSSSRTTKLMVLSLCLAGLGIGLLSARPVFRSGAGIRSLGRISRLRDRELSAPREFKPATLVINDAPVVTRFKPPSQFVGADGQLVTAVRIQRFLGSVGSPLTQFAGLIVDAGVRYGVDPRVVVAISGVESTFGRFESGHNAWGWGKMSWASWPVAIDSYTHMLGDQYHSLRSGRFSAASRTYCPPCGDRWGVHALEIFTRI